MRTLRASMADEVRTGLGWGLGLALIEGLPLLWRGTPWPALGARLLALAYLAVLYGVLGAVLCALLGLPVAIVSQFRRSTGARPPYPAIAPLAALTAALLWAHRLNPTPPAWAGIALLAPAAGLVAARLASRAEPTGRPPQPPEPVPAAFAPHPPPDLAGGRLSPQRRASRWALRALPVALFLVAAGAVGGAALFRAPVRDRLLAGHPGRTGPATAERPNVVLITAGGLRADHLGVYGYDPTVSPHIDALAGRGVVFQQAVAPSSWTVPSLASLLTSLYPSELGIACRPGRNCTPHLDRQRATLAEALRGAGYHTRAAVGSPWPSRELGFDQGFDAFESVRAEEPFDLGPMRSGTLGRLLGCRRHTAACRLFEAGHALLFDKPLPAGYGGDEINGHIAEFLELHGRERFFVWVHYAEALPPYDLEPPFRPLVQDPLASPERRLRNLGYWELGDPFTVREELLPLDDQGLVALYDGEVHRLDRLVGGLVGQLEAYGLAERTLIIVTSDHGQELFDHGGYTFGHTLYEEVVRVPLIVAGAGVTASGQGVGTPVSLLDLFPTVAEVTGVPLPPEAEGRSLLPALQGGALADRPVYSEGLYRVAYELKAVRRGGYKLIYNVQEGQVELYDLQADPAENQNVAQREVEIAGEMRQAVLDWMRRAEALAHHLPRAMPPATLQDAIW